MVRFARSDPVEPPADSVLCARGHRGVLVGLVHRPGEKIDVHRLAQVVVDAVPESLHRRVEVGVAGDDDDLAAIIGGLKGDLDGDILAYYKLFDVVVIPSLSEGIPITLGEAMACGLPTAMTGSRKPDRGMVGRCAASTGSFWSGTP